MKKPGNPELNTERRQFFFECDIEHCDFEQMALDNSNHELYYFFRNNCATHVSPSYFQAAYTNFEAENIEFFLQDSFDKFQHIAINMLLPLLKQDHHTSKYSKKFFDVFLLNSHLFANKTEEVSYSNPSSGSNIAAMHHNKFINSYVESSNILAHIMLNNNDDKTEISTLLTFEGKFQKDAIESFNDALETLVSDHDSLIKAINISEALQMAIAISNDEYEDQFYTIIKTKDIGPNGGLIYVYVQPQSSIILSENSDLLSASYTEKRYIEYGLRNQISTY